LRPIVLSLAVLALASACVSITPHPPVAIASAQRTAPPGPTTSYADASDPPTVLVTLAPRSPKPSGAPRATPTPTRPPETINSDDPACNDDAYNLEGFHWNTIWRWRYNAANIPSNLDSDEALGVIQTAVDNIVDERNDCGRPDTVHALAQYVGKTGQAPCGGKPDGENTIGWGAMPSDLPDSADVLAYTCPAFEGGEFQIAIEADIVINDAIPWSLTKADCLFQYLLEPTMTHEVGHVFGLDHVTEHGHGDLTMSTTINNFCSEDEASLGLGDMLGLESLYPGN
jgi:hypothetical protein